MKFLCNKTYPFISFVWMEGTFSTIGVRFLAYTNLAQLYNQYERLTVTPYAFP